MAGLILSGFLFLPGWRASGQSSQPGSDDSQRVEVISQSGGPLTGALPLGDGTILAAEGPALIRLLISNRSTQVLARRDLGHGEIVDLALCGDGLCALTVEGLITLSGTGPEGLPASAGFAAGGGQTLVAQGDRVVIAARKVGLRLLSVGPNGVIGAQTTVSLPGEAIDVALDRRNNRVYAALGDAGVAVIDLADVPVLSGTLTAITPADSVAIVGRLLVIGSGRRVVLIDPAAGGQAAVGAYAPLTEGRHMLIQGDYAYVADALDGLKILWLAGADRPLQVYGEANHPAQDIAVDHDTAYVVGPDGLRILDVSNRYRPLQIASLALPAEPLAITLADSRAFIAMGDQGVAVVDVSNQSMPRLSRVIAVGGAASASAFTDGWLYVAAGDAGMAVIDANTPGGETLLTSLPLPGPALDVALRADGAYLTLGESGLVSVDISRRNLPVIAGVLPASPGHSDQAITISGKRAYVAQADGFIIADVSYPRSMGLLGSVQMPSLQLAANDDYLYALGGDQIAIYDARATAEPVYLRAYRGLRQSARIVISSQHAFVTSAGDGPDMIVLDLAAPDSPYELDNVGETGHTYRPDAASGLILLPAGFDGLRTYSLTENGALIAGGSYSSMPDVTHLAADGARLLIGGQAGWSLADRATAAIQGTLNAPPVRGLALDGNTAALAGIDTGVALYSVTNPARPQLLARRDTSGPANGIALDPNFVYVADAAGLAIDDRRYLAQAQRIALPAPPGGIAVAGGMAYLPLADGTLAVIDLGDPAGGIQTLGTASTARPTALIPAPDGTVYGLADTQVSRLALGDLRHPAAVTLGTLPQVGVRGQFFDDLLGVFTPGDAFRFYDPLTLAAGTASYGEVNLSAVDITVNWPLAYAAYGEGGLGVVDLEGRQALPPFYTEPVEAVTREGDRLFAAGAELTAWDITQRDQPRLLATLPLDFTGRHVDPAAGGNLLVSTETGLAVAHWDGSSLSPVGSISLGGPIDRALQIGQRVYAARHEGGLQAIDLADPAHPAGLVTLTSASGQFVHDLLKLDDSHLLVSWEGGIDVLDVGSPAATPHVAGTIPVDASASGISITPDGKRLALSLGDQGAALLDLSDPRQPKLVGRVQTPGQARAVALDGSSLYVADGTCGLRVIDVSDPSTPHEVGYSRGGYASDVLITPDGSATPPVVVAYGSRLARLRFDPTAPALPPPAPQSPDPPMDDSSAPIALTLKWGPPADPCNPITYDVYFGQDSNPPLLSTLTGEPLIEVPQLAPHGVYFWRVEATDAQGDHASGPLWRFTTAGADFPNGFPPSPPPFLVWAEENPLVSAGLLGLFVAIPGVLLLRRLRRHGAASPPERGRFARPEDIPDWYSSGHDMGDDDAEGPLDQD